MAYRAPLRRSLLPLLVTVSLAACSTDGLMVDSGTRVSAIEPQKHRQPLPESNSEQSYSIPDSAAPDQSGAYANAGGLAAPATTGPGRLPPIESDEALALNGATPSSAPQLGAPPKVLGQLTMTQNGQPLAVAGPSGGAQQVAALEPGQDGISMDAGLGVEAAAPSGTSLAQEEANQIAEGNTTEPLVGGIGTDNPVAYPSAQPQRVAPEQDPLLSELDYPETAPASPRQSYPAGQQVAMLPRPADPTVNPTLPPRPAVMPRQEVACRQALVKMGVKFQDVPAISNGPACGIPYPIKVYGFASNIQMKPAINLNCQVTYAFAQWVKNELNPSARYRYWSGIKTIIPLGGYSCRRMNSSARNPWSEHARGNAIDVGKFILNSGKEIDVRKPGFFSFREKGLLNAVRSESCKYFHTVLGPGSDPHHKDHFHFDLRARKSGYRHCD